MSQSQQLLHALKRGDVISPMEALKRWGIFRLAARVCDLRDAGVPVKSQWQSRGGKRWKIYSL